MTEQKKPAAGEWWQHTSGTRLCAAWRDEHEVLWVWYSLSSNPVAVEDQWDGWKQLDGCTGFNWVEPVADVWPKYYLTSPFTADPVFHFGIKNAHYYRLDSSLRGECVDAGGSVRVSSFDIQRIRSSPGSWIEVTEAEALARVKPVGRTCVSCGEKPAVENMVACKDCWDYSVDRVGVPVELPDDWVEISNSAHLIRKCDQISDYGTQWYGPSSLTGAEGKRLLDSGFLRVRCRRIDLPLVELPDDWVTQDRVHPRPACDYFRWRSKTQNATIWAPVEAHHKLGGKHGFFNTSDCTTLEVQCGREDLPKQPLMIETYAEQPAVNRVAVRLWRDKESGQIVGTLPGDEYAVGDLAEEVKSDGNGGWELRIPQ